MPAFWNKCPNCGKRFKVRHTGEDVEKDVKVVTTQKPTDATLYPTRAASVGLGLNTRANSAESPMRKVDVAVEEDTYTESYECMHCGHRWTEKVEKDEELSEVGRHD